MARSVVRCACWIVLATLALSVTGHSHSVGMLKTIVDTEVIREISMAAGLALADSYAESRPVEELEALAEEGRTPGIRLAARTALDSLSDPLQALVVLTEDELMSLAVSAETSLERLNASRAYYVKIRGALTAERLESDATESESVELSLAAGETLAGFYLSFQPRSEAELIDQTLHGATAGLRVAASLALSSHLIRTSTLTEEEIMAAIAEHTMWHTELAEAYMHLLAHRFSGWGGLS